MKPRNAVGPLFVGRDGKKARNGLRRPWLQVCRAAGSVEVFEIPGKRGPLKRYKPTVRKHDLRHAFASHLVSNGVGLQVVGRLLGHTTAHTTMRYAHIADQQLRDAADQSGKILKFESAKRA
jgi:integrase